ncbi:hypothetical protein D3C72_1728960 [compost metagenome]
MVSISEITECIVRGDQHSASLRDGEDLLGYLLMQLFELLEISSSIVSIVFSMSRVLLGQRIPHGLSCLHPEPYIEPDVGVILGFHKCT